MTRKPIHGGLAVLALATIMSGPAMAQDLFIYPAQGQSEEQQSKDRYECHSWAVGQTGYDPSNPATHQTAQAAAPPPPSQEPTEGGLLKGAARGAAVGAVGGAIAGDAGKGAAIGAGTGALIGGMRRKDQRRRQEAEQQQYQQQVQQAQAQQQAAASGSRDNYNRAITACLEARGYTVN